MGRLAHEWGTRRQGDLAYFSLDNEPRQWDNSTHSDIGPRLRPKGDTKIRTSLVVVLLLAFAVVLPAQVEGDFEDDGS
jgi:hypothetical protein